MRNFITFFIFLCATNLLVNAKAEGLLPLSAASLIEVQKRYNHEDLALRNIANERAGTELSENDFQLWLDSVRNGDDSELKNRLFARERAYRDMLQIVKSMTRSVGIGSEGETQLPTDTAQHAHHASDDIRPLLQKLGELRAMADELKTHGETLPAEKANHVKLLEQEILNLLTRKTDSEILAEDADGDTL